jgi:hypothetical protein
MASMKMMAWWYIAPCPKVGDVVEVGDIALMMEVVCTSETSVYFKTTQCYIPQGYIIW